MVELLLYRYRMDYHYKWSNTQVTKAASVFYLISKIIMAVTIITKKKGKRHTLKHTQMHTYKEKQGKKITKTLTPNGF